MSSAPNPSRPQHIELDYRDPRFSCYPADLTSMHGRLLVISLRDLVLWSREGEELARVPSVGGSQRFYPSARPDCVLLGPTSPGAGNPLRLFQVTDSGLTLLKERLTPELEFKIGNIHAVDTEEGLYIATSDLFAFCDWEQDEPIRKHPLQSSTRTICFSPDGTRLAVSHKGRTTIEILSTADGTVVQELSCEGTPWSGYVVVDWGEGGHFLTVTSSRRGLHIEVWDPITGERLHKRTTFLTRHDSTAARLSPDGRIADIGFSKGMLLRMDVSTGQVLWSQEQAFEFRMAVDHGDDGDWLFTTSDKQIIPRRGHDGSERVMMGTGKDIKQVHWDRVSRMLVVQGEMAATVYDEKGVLQRRLPSVMISEGDRAGEVLIAVPTNGPHWREVRRVSLVDGTVRPWQIIAAGTRRMVQEGDRLVLVNDSRGGRTGVDILSTEGRLIQFVPGEVGRFGYQSKPIFYTALSKDGQWLAKVSERTLSLVGVADREQRWSVSARSTMKPELLAFCPRAELLALCVGRNLQLYRLDSSDPVLSLKLPRGLFLGWFIKPRRLLLLLTDGRLLTLDITKKRKTYSGEPVVVAHLKSDLGTAHLTEEGMLFATSRYGGSLFRYDLKKLLKIRKPRRTAPPPWEPTQQVLAERDRLLALEREEGITDEHRRITSELLAHPAARGRLCHRFGHESVLSSHAVSPDGRYLATGCWTGEDYDRGGSLMVWEMATGRPLTIIDGIAGGIGWPDEDGCMQWSPDGEELGMIFHTNAFGNHRVFDPEPSRSATVDATDGWDSPPAFCWGPDGRNVAISCWGKSPIPGLVATLERGSMHHDEMRSFASALPDWAAEQDVTEVEPARKMRWSSDGQTLLCGDRGTLYAVDIPTGELLWHGYGRAAAFSPAGRWIATAQGGVTIREARTGEPAFTAPDIPDISALIWAACADETEQPGRLAAVIAHDDPAKAGVILVDGGQRVGRVPVQPASRPANMEDTVVWAFSSDGRQGACLEASGGVSVWQLDGEAPTRIAGPFQPDGKAGAVALGGGAVALIGRELVQIWRIADEECLTHYQPSSPRTDLIDTPSPLGNRGSRYHSDPAFPLRDADGKYHWVVALENGTVIAPEAVQSGLDAALTWVIEGRWAWPWRWSEPALYTSLEEAADADALPFAVPSV